MILAVPEPIQWTTAIGGIVGAIAWPLAVLILGITFRSHIGEILGRATHAKVGPIELDMQEQQEAQIVEGLSEETAAVDGKPTRQPARTLLSVAYFQAARDNPLNAVIEGFLGVEHWLNKTLLDHHLDPFDGVTKRSVLEMVRLANAQGLISDVMVNAAERLASLRESNISAPQGTLSTEDARAFLTLCDGTINLMEADVRYYDETHPTSAPA